MKVIVCGAGQVGYAIARQLSLEQNDVTVVDQDPTLVQRVNDTLNARGMQGFASHPDALDQAGAADADMLIAVTFADEVNMVACQVAHSLFKVPTKIARVRHQNYLKPAWRDLYSRTHLPIDVIISPELEVARAVLRRLELPGAFDNIAFAGDKVRVIGVTSLPETPIVGSPLRHLSGLFPDLSITMLGIGRGEGLMVPRADDQVLAGDEVYFAADSQHIARALSLMGHEEKEARRVIIVGGGNIGGYIAKQLEQRGSAVRAKVIEVDRGRAEYLAEQLDRTVVLNGSALDQEILKEANVQQAEALVAVTNDDEVNILVSLLAKRSGCKRAIALVNNAAFTPLVTPLGIDAAVNPRATTVSSILQHVRRGSIRRVHSLRDGAAEVIEAEALETSGLVGKPLHAANLPHGIIVGAIVRQDKVIMPRADTTVEIGDRVIIFALAEQVKKVEKLFAVRLEFF